VVGRQFTEGRQVLICHPRKQFSELIPVTYERTCQYGPATLTTGYTPSRVQEAFRRCDQRRVSGIREPTVFVELGIEHDPNARRILLCDVWREIPDIVAIAGNNRVALPTDDDLIQFIIID
jgi:hypothetical protein